MEENSLDSKEEGPPVNLVFPHNSSRLMLLAALYHFTERSAPGELHQHPMDLNETMRFTGCNLLCTSHLYQI